MLFQVISHVKRKLLKSSWHFTQVGVLNLGVRSSGFYRSLVAFLFFLNSVLHFCVSIHLLVWIFLPVLGGTFYWAFYLFIMDVLVGGKCHGTCAEVRGQPEGLLHCVGSRHRTQVFSLVASALPCDAIFLGSKHHHRHTRMKNHVVCPKLSTIKCFRESLAGLVVEYVPHEKRELLNSLFPPHYISAPSERVFQCLITAVFRSQAVGLSHVTWVTDCRAPGWSLRGRRWWEDITAE